MCGRELDRVAQEIGDDLENSRRIKRCPERGPLDLHGQRHLILRRVRLEELIPRSKRRVGSGAFNVQILVRLFAFARKDAGALGAFPAKRLVRGGPLLRKRLVFPHSLPVDNRIER